MPRCTHRSRAARVVLKKQVRLPVRQIYVVKLLEFVRPWMR